MDMDIKEAINLSIKYDRMKSAERDALRDKRMRDVVMYAKENSPYFSKLYAGIDKGFSLSELPFTTKVEMMENFDEWVTDREIRLDDIYKFMENKDNIGDKYLGKYLIHSTSGSTGNPAVILYDQSVRNSMDATDYVRAIASKWDSLRYVLRGAKRAGIYTKGGFYLGSGMIRTRLLENPKSAGNYICEDILDPIPKIVERLNRHNPSFLSSYPTCLTLLADEKLAGRLKISPVVILSSGEKLMSDARKLIEGAFKCTIQDNYYCSEGGALASECQHKHCHLNDDWIIMEPVDKQYRPVPNGQISDRWLLTCLSAYAQPLIRYEITDRVTLHDEGCACGRLSPWVEIEGRADDLLIFKGTAGEVKILPAAFYAILSEIRGIKRFQVIVHKGKRVELRLEAENKAAVFEEASAQLGAYLANNGAPAEIVLSDALPQYDKSGKFRRYYMEN
jgi:phenylacetate-coenzyme A ligase PaaK-like adenylate-forming protein